jgi:hypothetical protein
MSTKFNEEFMKGPGTEVVERLDLALLPEGGESRGRRRGLRRRRRRAISGAVADLAIVATFGRRRPFAWGAPFRL